MCLCGELGDVARDYCLSCVHQIISVVRISSTLVIAFPLPLPPTHPPTHAVSLSNTRPLGQWSVGIILHILCGEKPRVPDRFLVRKSDAAIQTSTGGAVRCVLGTGSQY